MKKILFLISFLLFYIFSNSQTCLFDDFASLKNTGSTVTTTNQIAHFRDVLTIPVVIHIVWRNEEQKLNQKQIQSQIDQLNRDFLLEEFEKIEIEEVFREFASDTGIQFCLASKMPDGEPTSGITYTQTDRTAIGLSNDIYFTNAGGKDAWDTKKYLNIWVCEQIEGLLGFASSPIPEDELKDGVVINFQNFGTSGSAYDSESYNLGKTLTHEIGHYLGLLHPWGRNGGECEEDDLIEDTPRQSQMYGGCQLKKSSCDSEDMLQNFMQVAVDECLLFFSQGQVNRMRDVLNTSRRELTEEGSSCSIFRDNSNIKLEIFPNPTNGLVHFLISEEVDNHQSFTFKIMDSMGHFIRKIELRNKEISLVDLSLLPKGLYFIGNENCIKKVLLL